MLQIEVSIMTKNKLIIAPFNKGGWGNPEVFTKLANNITIIRYRATLA